MKCDATKVLTYTCPTFRNIILYNAIAVSMISGKNCTSWADYVTDASHNTTTNKKLITFIATKVRNKEKMKDIPISSDYLKFSILNTSTLKITNRNLRRC